MIKQNGQSGLATTSIFNKELIPCHPGLDVFFFFVFNPYPTYHLPKNFFPGTISF